MVVHPLILTMGCLISPNTYIVELKWLEQLWNHENISRLGKFELMSVNHSARSGGIIGIFFDFFSMKVCCVFSLASPHQGDSNEHTHSTIFKIYSYGTFSL